MDKETALSVLAKLGVSPLDEVVKSLVDELHVVYALEQALEELQDVEELQHQTRREQFLAIAARLCAEVMVNDWEPSQRVARVSQGHKMKRQLPTPDSSQERISPTTPPAKRVLLAEVEKAVEPPSPSKSIDSPTTPLRRTFTRPGHDQPYTLCTAGASQTSINSKLERMPWLCTFFLYYFLSTSPRWSWKAIEVSRLQDLQKSETPVKQGIEIIKVIARQIEDADDSIWVDDVALKLLVQEAERELAAFADTEAVSKGKGKSLGTFGNGADGFSGGKIKYAGKIISNTDRPSDQQDEPLIIRLSPPSLTQSCHFTRRFGSNCVLRLRFVPAKGGKLLSEAERNELHHFCQRPLVLAGRLFRLVHNNDGVLYYAAINPCMPRLRTSSFTSRFLHAELDSLESLCKWWGEPSLNGPQRVVKWASRLHLLFSPTQPVAKFEHILPVQDFISPSHEGSVLPPQVVMTDGVCWVSYSAMKQAQHALSLNIMPAAVQARIHGSKGVWLYNAAGDFDEPLRIGIRPSQCKVVLSPAADDSWLILNVVRPSKLSYPANLSYQLLPILTHNGVPSSLLVELQRCALMDCGAGLMEWSARAHENRAAQLLRMLQAVYATGVIGGRLRRKAGSSSRAKGLGSMEAEDEDDSDDIDTSRYEGYGSDMSLPSGPSSAIARDRFSGLPNSMGETAIELLAAGFLPQENFYLAAKMYNLAQAVLDNRTSGSKRFNIPVEQSASAMCVVDEVGVLEEDEISFCFSETLLDDNGLPITELVGDVLVIRSPAYLPSDIIRMKAVYRLALRTYKDVVVFSAKGSRSPASRLSGGDYDGDRVTVIWHQQIVQPFLNAPISFLTVDALYTELETMDATARQTRLQQVLSASVKATSLADSKMHFARAWKYGLADAIALDLAHKAALALDAGKSGMTIKPTVLSADRREADKLGDPKIWDVIKEKSVRTRNAGRTAFRHGKDEHILDAVDRWAERIRAQCISAYAAQRMVVKDACQRREDTDLSARWRRREADCEATEAERADLALLKDDLLAWIKIQAVSSEKVAAIRERARHQPPGSPIKSPRKEATPSSGSTAASSANDDYMSQKELSRQYRAALPLLTSKFASRVFRTMSEHDLDLLRASGAYLFSYNVAWARAFAYDVTFREICALKAESLGTDRRAVVEDVWCALKVDKRFTV